ncbi:hypothetical protein PTNB73_10280 [Pyrenophora teres f. teres]|nr:hypothetical protein HRS9139_09910 [Pyrenophora teres f. teres]KAE8826299.1 hypothetical protein PTNB85_09244 [Pyrenophora teres f. teres]KAE8832689.1 hypothetical protein HRS9122_08402 [Pyrenophora teres f. teres]KAE8852641.1 hypothetical protein PTNB29_10031 [Pyrenophora teres f. teres]KAE8854850.1 hypothetical protein PTNB73_10280 [Pyrenophora teres f. teres]
MTLQTPLHLPSNEPSIVVNIVESEVEPQVNHPLCPPQSLKRRVSETRFYRGGQCEKRKRTSAPGLTTAIGRPCSPRPTYCVTMSQPWSRKDSDYSTLPTTPPTPGFNEADDSRANPRRPSQVAELLEKTIARLKRIFGSRRGSTDDESVPSNPYNTQRSSISQGSETQEEQAWRGTAHLPHVSMFFDANGEEGPSLFYTTADWNAFQTALQARRMSIQTHLHSDMQYDGDTDQDELHQSTKHRRKDSQFSFGGLLKTGYFNKIDKGKGRMVYHDAAPTSTKESLLASPSKAALAVPFGDIGILPHSSTDGNSLLASSDVPRAEFSNPRAGHCSPVLSGSQKAPEEIPPVTRLLSIRMVTPGQSYEDLASRADSNSTRSSPSSSGINLVAVGNREFQTVRRLSQTSTTVDGPEQPEPRRQPLTHEDFVTNSSSNSSLTSLRHGDRPDTVPSSPHLLRPTCVPSLDAMQTLTLGPPSQAILSTSYSSEPMFRLSAEHLAAPTRPAPLGPSSLARTTLAGENGEDEMDFSITHPAPPSPVPDAVQPDPMHPVLRRDGGLKRREDLRSAYVEQGGSRRQMSARAALIKVTRGRLSPKKSLQDQCWWGEGEGGAMVPPKQYL